MHRAVLLLLVPLMVACTGKSTSEDSADTTPATTDSGTTDTTDPNDTVEIPDEIYGELPAVSLPAPEFVATNYDGTTRGITDLTDGPTVVWFFPAAGTYG